MSWDRWAEARGLTRREVDTMLKIEQVNQSGSADCGPACVSAVLRFWGFDVEAPGVHEYVGMSPDYLESCLRRAGVNVLAGEMDLTDLAFHTGRGRPVVALIRAGGVGHYVVCKGVTSRGVAVMDPDGGRERYGKREFLGLWSDAARSGAVYHRYGLAVWRGPA